MHTPFKGYTRFQSSRTWNLSEEDARNMASRLLLLSIFTPYYGNLFEFLFDYYGIFLKAAGPAENGYTCQNAQMALPTLLGYSSAAERSSLIVKSQNNMSWLQVSQRYISLTTYGLLKDMMAFLLK